MGGVWVCEGECVKGSVGVRGGVWMCGGSVGV